MLEDQMLASAMEGVCRRYDNLDKDPGHLPPERGLVTPLSKSKKLGENKRKEAAVISGISLRKLDFSTLSLGQRGGEHGIQQQSDQ